VTDTAARRTRSDTTSWGWVLALGVVMILLGLLLFGAPLITAVAGATLVGAALVVLGIGGIVVGAKSARPSRRWTDILFGVVAVLVGLYCFAFPLAGSMSLTFAVGFWLLFRGVLELVSAFRSDDGTGKALLFLSALLDIILGVLLLANYPFPAVQFLGIALALSLIFAGFTTVIGAFGLRRLQSGSAVSP